MTPHEARFILGACRPDGRDAADPMFTEALALAERDPELCRWLERQRSFDATLAAKLRQVAPPAELREVIMAGVRASQPRRRWWARPGWLAAAAAIAIVVTVSIAFGPSGTAPTVPELTTFALNDLAQAHDNHLGFPPEFADLQAQLTAMKSPMPAARDMAIDLGELRRKNCRSVSIAGREVFEICFLRDGAWYHLYVGRRSDFSPASPEPGSPIISQNDYVAAAWVDSKHVYALVTHAGEAALRRLL